MDPNNAAGTAYHRYHHPLEKKDAPYQWFTRPQAGENGNIFPLIYHQHGERADDIEYGDDEYEYQYHKYRPSLVIDGFIQAGVLLLAVFHHVVCLAFPVCRPAHPSMSVPGFRFISTDDTFTGSSSKSRVNSMGVTMSLSNPAVPKTPPMAYGPENKIVQGVVGTAGCAARRIYLQRRKLVAQAYAQAALHGVPITAN
jgi:hypothetical protein